MNLAAILIVTVLGLGLVSAGEDLMESLANARAVWKNPKKTLEACRDGGDLTDDLAIEVSNRKLTELTPKGKCFLACAAEKFELVVGGKVATDNIMQFVRVVFAQDQDQTRRATRLALTETAVNACADELNARTLDRCELAAGMRDCFFKSDMTILTA